MEYDFFAMISRMKYIERWALMRNSIKENISEHSLEVSMLAHALALIGNKRLGKNYNPERAAMLGLYHDATEIITGDMPTPIKYYNDQMKTAFQEVENIAAMKLLSMLPEDLREEYSSIFIKEKEDKELYSLVKAADKLSALIKCIEEGKTGNTEFSSAKRTIEDALNRMKKEEVSIFMTEFLPSYYKNLDELK